MWANTMEQLIKVENLNILLRSNFCLKSIPRTTEFYREVLKALESLRTKNNKIDFSKEYIFYNQLLTVNKKLIYDNDLFSAGMWRLQDLFDSNNRTIPFHELKMRGVTNKSFIIWRCLVQKVKIK